MTGSRSGMTCLVVVLAALLFAGRRRMSVQMTAVMGVCVALGTAALLQWASADAALQRFGDSSASLASRLNICAPHWEPFDCFPGLAVDSILSERSCWSINQTTGLRYVEAHNDYLQLLVEGGVLTFVLAIAAIISLVRCIRLRFDAGDDGAEGHWVRVGAAIGFTGYRPPVFRQFSLQMPGNTALCAARSSPSPLTCPPQIVRLADHLRSDAGPTAALTCSRRAVVPPGCNRLASCTKAILLSQPARCSAAAGNLTSTPDR